MKIGYDQIADYNRSYWLASIELASGNNGAKLLVDVPPVEAVYHANTRTWETVPDARGKTKRYRSHLVHFFLTNEEAAAFYAERVDYAVQMLSTRQAEMSRKFDMSIHKLITQKAAIV